MSSIGTSKANDDQLDALLLGMKLAALHIDRLTAELREKDERVVKLEEDVTRQYAITKLWMDSYHLMRDQKDAQWEATKARIRAIFGKLIGDWLMKI